jgi:hypothetical protein
MAGFLMNAAAAAIKASRPYLLHIDEMLDCGLRFSG